MCQLHDPGQGKSSCEPLFPWFKITLMTPTWHRAGVDGMQKCMQGSVCSRNRAQGGRLPLDQPVGADGMGTGPASLRDHSVLQSLFLGLALYQ